LNTVWKFKVWVSGGNASTVVAHKTPHALNRSTFNWRVLEVFVPGIELLLEGV
jgi:hypothetical protein